MTEEKNKKKNVLFDGPYSLPYVKILSYIETGAIRAPVNDRRKKRKKKNVLFDGPYSLPYVKIQNYIKRPARFTRRSMTEEKKLCLMVPISTDYYLYRCREFQFYYKVCSGWMEPIWTTCYTYYQQSLHSCHNHIIVGFLINVQVQGQHPHQWAPFQIAVLLHALQISHQISRYVYHEG